MKRFLLLLLLLIPQLIYAEYFKHIGMSKGLSQPSVMTIYQDTLGRMWFGTKEGINVYDGNTIVPYKAYVDNHSGKGGTLQIDNDIRTITGDKNGDIFFIAEFSLIKYDIKKEEFTLMTTRKTHALTSYEGNIWCIIDEDLFFYNHKTDSLELVMHTGIKSPTVLTVTKENFYIGSRQGLFVTNRQKKSIRQLIAKVDIHRVFESSHKDIWVGCRMEGLYRIDEKGSVKKIPYLPDSPDGVGSEQIRDFAEDTHHNIWFGTFDGLQKYDYQTGKFSLIKANKKNNSIEHPSIFAVYKDKQGIIWLGSYYGGVNYFNPSKTSFSRYNYDRNTDNNLFFSYIGDMTEDKEKNLWICTDGGGLSRMDSQTHVFTNFKAGKGNALPHNNIKTICYDKKRNHLYIGTHLGGLSRYDITRKQFYNYLQKTNKLGNIIFHTEFRNDLLYLSTNTGFFVLNPETNDFKCLSSDIFYYNFTIDNQGYAWLVSFNNLICINVENPQDVTTVNLENYNYHFRATKIKATPKGDIYFGTLGSGLFHYNPKTKQMQNYSVKNGKLLSDYCYNLAITPLGNVLITSDKGIILFSPANQSFRSIELSSDYPSPAIINDCGIYITTDNEIYVGDTKGLTSFRENDLKVYGNKLNLYFSKLSINNQQIYPNDETGVLTAALPFTKELSLKYNQNNLTINFAISHFADLQQIAHYEYKLEGFDANWIQAKQTDLHYTNLDPGKYTLRIRTIKSECDSEAEEISLPIRISSPWYNSFWSWAVYLSVVIACILYYIRSQTSKKTLILSLEKEQFEKQQIEQMNQAKLLFFTNVSHEFRTPLTLINSHAEQLLQQTGIPPVTYNHVLKIYKNTRQMKNLVSDLLDFRKFEQNHVTLKIANQNLVTFLKEIHYVFLDYAKQRNIDFRFSCDSEQIECWFDAIQMERVFFNLLSNAFKYTPDNGKIEIDITTEPNNICIRIKDNGVGIDSSDTAYIFDRFYQGNNKQKSNTRTQGTGIGLALTKSIVEKHHGTICVESEKEKGSTFIVYLKTGKEHFANDANIVFSERVKEKSLIPDSLPVDLKPDTEEEQMTTSTQGKATLLIVEDNKEVLGVLQQLFSPYYHTLIAHNGKEGLELVIDKKPDLIISDVMMPEMTGTEMCMKIKNDINLCHIPVILLTALNTREQNIEGLNSGADDYITKPFDARMLLARCNNLLRNRFLIQRQLNDKFISEIDLEDINPLDKEFLKRAIEIIEAHMDNPNFDIPMLCKEIGMGRTALYSKFKALTDMTPNNFILNHKLKQASAMLIKYHNMPVAEISDRLGFSSAVYFTRCFKKQYNDAPQSYRKKQTGN